MTEAELAGIEARANAATSGPWVARRESNSGGTLGGPVAEMYWGDGFGGDSLVVGRPRDDDLNITYNADADATFIANARSAVPALLAEVRRLRAGLREIATSLPAHADGACCFQDQGYPCECDIAAVQQQIAALLTGEPI